MPQFGAYDNAYCYSNNFTLFRKVVQEAESNKKANLNESTKNCPQNVENEKETESYHYQDEFAYYRDELDMIYGQYGNDDSSSEDE